MNVNYGFYVKVKLGNKIGWLCGVHKNENYLSDNEDDANLKIISYFNLKDYEIIDKKVILKKNKLYYLKKDDKWFNYISMGKYKIVDSIEEAFSYKPNSRIIGVCNLYNLKPVDKN